MCGIVGLITQDRTDLERRIVEMNSVLKHRGPDEEGSMAWPTEGAALAMRRLSIVDLADGHQPMLNEDGQVAVVFNGEIYNAAALRQELVLRGHRFRTDHSDTEVLVHGYEQWGEELFPRLNGMFAVCIWDRSKARMVLARDRAGEKPLYIAKLRTGYAIASEIKAILRHPEVHAEIDFAALEQYLAFDFILSPATILKGVMKLPAGHYAVVTTEDVKVNRYWAMTFEPRPWVLDDCIAELDRALDRAVESRMVADVPIGVFLSGGLDSTTVAYYMRRHSDEVHSLSIGFEDPAYDESNYSLLAANSLGTKHHLEVFSEERIKSIVPRIADILDEPMADQSIFPTFLLSEVAAQRVKVALGGDGGDELLMGYGTYKALKVAWQADFMPESFRHALSNLASFVPGAGPKNLARGKRLLRTMSLPPAGRLLCSLGSYRGNSRWILSSEVRAGLVAQPLGRAVEQLTVGNAKSLTSADVTMAAYFRGYLQEDILVKVDRASMATSLEVRAPFLDPDLISFLAQVPSKWKLHGMTGKYILRKLMRGRIPDQIIDRKKHGFGVPLNSWMRSSLAPLVRDYLAPDRLRSDGVFDSDRVDALVREHMSGIRDNGQQLWPLLLFQMWRERWLARPQQVPDRQVLHA